MSHRQRLLRLAYRRLGTVSETEGVVQESWLRFAAIGEVEDAARLLPVIVTRLSRSAEIDACAAPRLCRRVPVSFIWMKPDRAGSAAW